MKAHVCIFLAAVISFMPAIAANAQEDKAPIITARRLGCAGAADVLVSKVTC